ncbi:TPA: hypothetical protein DDW69_01590 [candidate division CPR2 bacterium]|uniref:Asparagine synthetase n=1 Tax=candidate division CPR2 bacterium GW2011_GWC1_41_48 TaxID=1618344 RepID=A0A0G0YJL4_UNCC2|nr:MAG: Asparagine synthetase [candidate division CPR2 bacterium GW2011_GWC2_39_35]KKR28578.1 MAG: Asparagine synthetase [candidate division CPR2 bacterium GW2011_GWD2_39_7]KKR29624.1 MAG: Asparagine synthetase [candidate division CPR2 bacterium GW2011_GWD1_39_7]KKS09716.1 MAG: Asparagine synthetase [candidate division CPR2 bacterium GW2011_GWC1_41_48]OGB56510.1 MAG: hypothetical protein A2Y27_01245 [candidate division CPR2 bacterium GWD1_39_7]OGB72835.1 MAG: hypothetical protein A2Y26_02590 [
MTNEYRDNLDAILSADFLKLKAKYQNQRVGILFSAGVDSSTIAAYARDFGLEPVLYNFGTEFSKDKEFAFKLAADIGLPLVFKEISREEIEEIIPFIKKELQSIRIEPNNMQIPLSVGVYLIGKKAKEDNIEVLLCGQGSDELFGGYKKYESLAEDQLEAQMQKDIKSVMASDLKRDSHMLSLSGILLEAPYTSKKFINYALRIPVEYKIRDDIKKFIIREVAKKRNLPEYITSRPKSAMQYSSGIQKIYDKIIKERRKLSS